MQNPGSDDPRMQKLAAVEREVMNEKASALGITGRKLQASLGEYQRHRRDERDPQQSRELLARIARNLHDLLIQREAIGLPYQNLEWVLGSYSVPREVLAKLGLRNDPP